METRISVVIPLYNKRDSISRALDSVFSQTFRPLEIIIVNDGSTDGSDLIAKQICHKKANVRVIDQINAGVSAARNRGINEATGEWIALLDSDDYWEPYFLETISNLHETYPEAGVIITSYRYFFGDEVSLPKIKYQQKEGILEHYFRTACSGSPPIWTGAVCIEKNAMIKTGLFPVGVKNGEDLLTWARLAMQVKIAYTSRALSNYCFPIHIDSTQRFRLPDEVDSVGSALRQLLDQRKKDRDLKKYISHWHKMRMHLFIHHSMKKQSKIEYLKCIHYNLLNYKAHMLFLYSLLPRFLKEYIFNKVMNRSFK